MTLLYIILIIEKYTTHALRDPHSCLADAYPLYE